MADVRCQLGWGELHVHQGHASAELQQEEAAGDRGDEAQEHQGPSASFSTLTHWNHHKVLQQFYLFLTLLILFNSSPVLEFGDVLTPGTRVHVDLGGVAIINEDFLLNASFNSSQQSNKLAQPQIGRA